MYTFSSSIAAQIYHNTIVGTLHGIDMGSYDIGAAINADIRYNVIANTYESGIFFDNLNGGSFSGTIDYNNVYNCAPNYTGNVCSTEPPGDGLEADSILAFWSYLNQAMFVYDSMHGGYLRYDDRDADGAGNFVPSTDRMTGNQLLFNNVIVLWVQHSVDRRFVYDLEMDNSEGIAAVFRDGVLYKNLRWSTINEEYELETSVARPVKIRYPDGTPFPLAPGTSWHFIGDLSAELWEPAEAGAWKFRYYPPAGVD